MKKLLKFQAALALLMSASSPVFSANKIEATTTAAGSIPVYRLYNPNSSEHFYSSSQAERSKLIGLGWRDEGIGWYAPQTGDAVYRLYNPNVAGGDHYYTASLAERNALVAKGWNYDGSFWKSGGSVHVSVAYNPNAKSGAHNYTTNPAEEASLLRAGWEYPGTVWNAVAVGHPATGNQTTAASGVTAPHFSPVYYSELDGRWALRKFDKWTFGSTGCVPTVIAMALSGWGTTVLPPDVGETEYAIGRFDHAPLNSGTDGQTLVKTVQSYGYKVTPLATQAEIIAALKQGLPVAVAVKAPFIAVGYTHEILLYGYNEKDGSTMVYDPYGNAHTGRDPLSLVWNNQSGNQLDRDYQNVAFFAISK
jgi:hypothetical protein